MQVLPLLTVALIASGCGNPVVDDNTSGVTLSAAFESTSDTSVVGLESDVVTDAGTPEDDFFVLTVRSIPKNSTFANSPYYRVEFEGVQIFYTRVDGHNEPGVDVPFPMTYSLGGSVAAGGVTTVNLLAVSREMKLQPPLRNLWYSTNQRIFAQINCRIFGHDLVENSLTADATAVVVFADN